jgi:hypothetical protein
MLPNQQLSGEFMAEIPVKPKGEGATKAKPWIWWVIGAIVVILLFFLFSNRSSASEMASTAFNHSATLVSSDCPPTHPLVRAR